MKSRLLGIFALLAACDSSTTTVAPPQKDAGPQSTLVTVGKDVDDKMPRTLTAACPLPQAFADGLAASTVTSAQLTFPDGNLTFANDINRFHWTDDVRHQGDLAPQFACMVANDVKAALALGDGDTAMRELLVAQGIYGNKTAYQVSRYDKAITVDSSKDPLTAALQLFYTHPLYAGQADPGLPTWDNQSAGVAAQVSGLSSNAQVALAQAIRGLLEAADLRDQALTASGQLDIPGWQAQKTKYFKGKDSGFITVFGDAYAAANQMTSAMDYDLLSRAGQMAMRSVESLRIALKAEPLVDGATLDLTGPLGRIAVSLEQHNDTWAGNGFFLLVDGGGDDTYKDAIAVNADIYHPIATLLDLTGNDHYTPTKPYDLMVNGPPVDKGQGTGQAAGWFGVAILDDAAGDDQYLTGLYQAYGAWGVGALVDHGGNDGYKGYNRSQGASDFGYGLLVDLGGGRDKYETLHNSQGFGGTRGIGWLIDDAGNDSYLAVTTPIANDPASSPYDQEGSNFSGAQGFGWGLRVWNPQDGSKVAYLSGGLGGLFDFGGDDQYEAAVMCQAWGYFFGTGLLYDQSGKDTYKVFHKYGIGGATHQAVGVFMDLAGADTYDYQSGGVPTNGGSEGVGLGYDGSVGFHIDRGLDADDYLFEIDKQKWGEVMGIARFVGLGVLINEGGDDQYHLPGVMGAYALGMTDMPFQNTPYRSVSNGTAYTVAMGMFLDLAGKDTYDAMGSAANNDATWKQTARTTNSTNDPFDPSLDHGYGFDGTSTWPAWQ